ncbi:hypothetical protein [Natronobeatus ordinarius]|uniref:hypothetical protein n=1 Tax=Natronobeatus ordinarius TaxID=2963433 RepID=UPI0020CC72AA|nr:hypothetical protein [Natronobeatus ordinarius]
MPSLPKSHKEEIAPYIADGEQVIDAYSIVDELEYERATETTHLVTDRRFLVFDKETNNGRISLESTYLDSVGRVEITQTPSQEPDETTLMVAGLMMVLGVLSFGLIGLTESELGTIILLVGGLSIAAIGLVIFVDAFNTEDGSVSITLQTATGELVESVTFEEEALEFANSVSRAAANAHSTAAQLQKATQ